MNCFNVTVNEVAEKEGTNHKTLVSSLASLRNGKIFKSGKNGHFWKFNIAKWSKIANFGGEFET